MEETPQERETAEEEMSVEMTSMRGEDMKGEIAKTMATAPKALDATRKKTTGEIIRNATTVPSQQQVGMRHYEETSPETVTETSSEAQDLKEATGMRKRAIHQATVNSLIQVVHL